MYKVQKKKEVVSMKHSGVSEKHTASIITMAKLLQMEAVCSEMS